MAGRSPYDDGWLEGIETPVSGRSDRRGMPRREPRYPSIQLPDSIDLVPDESGPETEEFMTCDAQETASSYVRGSTAGGMAVARARGINHR